MISAFAQGSDDDCSRMHVIYSLGARATLFDQCKRKDLSTWFYNSPVVTSGKDSVKAWWWVHLFDVARSNIRCCSAGVLTGSPTGLKYIMQNVEERLQKDCTSAKWSVMRIVRLGFSDLIRSLGMERRLWCSCGGLNNFCLRPGGSQTIRRCTGLRLICPLATLNHFWTVKCVGHLMTIPHFPSVDQNFGTFCERVNRFTSLYNSGRFHLRPY